MKKTTLLRLTLTVIALILTVTMVSSCGILNLIAAFVVNNASENKAVDFNTIEYQRPDFEKITKAFDDLIFAIEEGESTLSILSDLGNASKAFQEAQTQYQIADIQYYNDVNNTFAKRESEICAEEFAKLQVKVTKMYQAILDNDLQDSLMVGWTKQDFDSLAVRIKLCDDEYVTIEKNITELRNEYMEKIANLTFVYNGVAYTIDQALALLTHITDEAEYREKYNEIVSLYYKSMATTSGYIYLKLIKLNNRIAEKAGYDSYAEYAYENEYMRDYTPKEIKDVYNFVKKSVLPLYEKTAYAIDSDLLAGIYQKEMTIDNHREILKTYFGEINGNMLSAYDFMKQYNLYSIGNKAGMQEAGFTTYLASYEMPYLYLYTNGNIDDISSFVHEFGHFYSFYKNGLESDGIIDVSEIQSQANELLFLSYYKLTDEEREQYTLSKLNDLLTVIIEGCLYDEFQSYAHENIDSLNTPADLNKAFQAIADQYQYGDIYAGMPYQYLWAAISHNFVAPFYYISYAMSAMPAISIYSMSLDNRKEAIKIYNNITDETGYRSYLQVLKDNNLLTPFETPYYEKLEALILSFTADDTAKTASLPKPYGFLGIAA